MFQLNSHLSTCKSNFFLVYLNSSKYNKVLLQSYAFVTESLLTLPGLAVARGGDALQSNGRW